MAMTKRSVEASNLFNGHGPSLSHEERVSGSVLNEDRITHIPPHCVDVCDVFLLCQWQIGFVYYVLHTYILMYKYPVDWLA
ncbi:hypothetical protein K503DRAFT_469511 [Rhizopogon vinicolor AM-OR11-026]|uniref:Uncharacterized protein n=1 Tax=Rhizopogon vinicolor AM-OR11-026 TaxID=1314800 RepID=A0A1B7MND0_9AGAM|nr:hypothetical protein K503DRAFT_469511 [Rhizopogon vinicolor AM-OR11-026]